MKNQAFHRRLGYALAGIREGLVREQSFRIQSLAGVVVIAALVLLRPTPIWWAIFVFLIFSILALELMNTALERLVDRLHPGQHESIRLAKDCAAGAVLLMSFASVIIFAIFLWERLA